MKQVRRLGGEPQGLAMYRATSPAEETRPPEEASDVWRRFRADAAYKDLLTALAAAQQGLCIYCEQQLLKADGTLVANDYQVEHVRAKSGGAGRALDWTNLALACGGGTHPHHADPSRQHAGAANLSCGQSKEDSDLPPGCDPRELPLSVPLLEIGLDGRIRVDTARCRARGVAPGDLTHAVDATLKLNCERLRTARQAVGDNIRTWFGDLLNRLSAGLLDQADLDAEVAERLRPSNEGNLRRFWTTERAGLGETAERWIAANQGMLT